MTANFNAFQMKAAKLIAVLRSGFIFLSPSSISLARALRFVCFLMLGELVATDRLELSTSRL